MHMNVFFGPGYLINISRSVKKGVPQNELIIKDQKLKKKIHEIYGDGLIYVWTVKQSILNRWLKIKPKDYLLFYNAGRFIYSATVSFKYPFDPYDRDQLNEARKFAEAV